MATFRGYVPRLRFGVGLGSSLWSPTSWDAMNGYGESRAGSERLDLPSGDVDAWTVGTDDLLSGRVRQIPANDELGVYLRTVSGWNGAAGWRAALAFARDAGVLAFHPDSRNLLVSPALAVDSNADGIVDDWTASGTGSGVAFSVVDPGDGGGLAQRIVVTSPASGSPTTPQIRQVVGPVFPGESVALSSAVLTSGVSGACSAFVQCYFLDALGARIGGAFGVGGTFGTFDRQGSGAVAPAGAASLEVLLGVVRATGTAAITATFRKPTLVRASTATPAAFIDNPHTLCTLVEPQRGAPDLEPSGRRALALVLRAVPGASFGSF